jgi:nitrogenase-stabilizing/protective protein
MTIGDDDFRTDLAELESAEDFLDYFSVPFDPAVVRISRLHILQRFHDYLARHCGAEPTREDYRRWLTRAYEDFVVSTPLKEKVFKVLRNQAGIATIPLGAIGGRKP